MKFNNSLVQILSPYGKWPHRFGMQLVDEKSLEQMKRAARFSTIVGCGIPIFVGHPDESQGAKAVPVGKISRIFSTGDGIAIEAKYTDAAFAKIASGKLKSMSPRWRMQKLPDGQFRPVKLISAGLTNNPNIPESGRIIKASAPLQARQFAALEKAETLAGVAKLAAEKAAKCSRAANRLGEISRSAILSARIELTKKTPAPAGKSESDTQPPDVKKISAKELAKLAVQRSKTRGEPYSKSFAAVRRQYKFPNNSTLKENNEK